MEKFLRKDIIDMKANGLDDRAYGRAITFQFLCLFFILFVVVNCDVM